MPYKDIQKKTLYQRNYMRMRRVAMREAIANHNVVSPNLKLINGVVRPSTSKVLDPVEYDADGNVIYDF